MKPSIDSPELTAYALGELDAVRRAEIEAALASDPDLRAEVDAIRRTAQQVQAMLAEEPRPALAEVQRRWVAGAAERAGRPGASAGRGNPGTRPAPWWAWTVGILGMTGAALVAVSLLLPRSGRTRWQSAAVRTSVTNRTPESFDSFRYRANESAPVAPKSGADPAVAPSVLAADAPAPTGLPDPGNAPSPARAPAGNVYSVDPVLAHRYGLVPAPPAAPAAPVPGQEGTPVRVSPTAGRPLATASARDAVAAAGPGEANLGFRGFRGERGLAKVEAKSVEFLVRESVGQADSKSAPGAEARLAEVDVELMQRLEDRLAPGQGEGYETLPENPFRPVRENPLSTFSTDVDTASYANVRRFLRDGQLPPPGAVRLEEFINYFRYQAPAPSGEHPVGARVEVADCPWAPGHRLVRVALKAREIARAERPAANLVFLVDVSGSMQPENKLPLVKQTLRLLVERLTPRDSVAIVTYAGTAGVALAPTSGSDKAAILAAIEALSSGGSTHGSAGITTAYELAASRYVEGGVNRVLLCTDGDFNVGLTSRTELLDLITAKAKTGVFLSVLGYGVGNFQDRTTELLADKGNGNYAYIDGFREAARVLDEQLESTLVTVAKDVKVQVEFNPARVASWRLLGYENRVLADRDFNDDSKDAGELGAGHAVTALYEIVPAGGAGPGVDPLRYGAPAATPAPETDPARSAELLFLKFRYKLPEASESRLLTVPVADGGGAWESASADFRFSAAAAGFGMLLRGSQHRGTLDHDQVIRLAEQALGADPGGYRAEMIDLVRRARSLATGR